MKRVWAAGALNAEANGLMALVLNVLRAGTAKKVCRSIDGRMIDAISLPWKRRKEIISNTTN